MRTALLFAPALLACAAPAAALEVLGGPTADAPTYAIVVVDSRKLRTPLSTALAAFPNSECVQTADANQAPNCPGLRFTGAYTYAIGEGFPKYADPRDPRKELRIDGLREKNWSNFRTPGQCTQGALGPVCPPVPPTEAVEITFTRPTTEFGFDFKSTNSGADGVFFTGFDVTVNGTYIGYYPVSPDNVVQYFGIYDPAGLQSVRIVPLYVFDGGTNTIGALLSGRLYYH